MKHNDPVAKRAHHVVRRILQNVAPILQEKAAELLDGGPAESASDTETSRFLDSSCGPQNFRVDWTRESLFDSAAPGSGRQSYPQSSDQSYVGTAQSSQVYFGYPLDDLQLSGTFGNPFINSWDERIPLAGIQNQWYNTGTAAANQEEDIGDMDLFPGSNGDQLHLQ